MAVPIRVIPSTPESKEEIAARLEESRIKHAKAILAGYQLLQSLHDAKVIDIMRGLASAGDPLATKLGTAMSSGEVINAARNFMSLAKIMGSIDPNFLHRLAEEIHEQAPGRRQVPKFWGAIRALLGKDGRRALAGTVAFISAFGKALGEPRRG